MTPDRDLRSRSFGQDYTPTAVDRFGVWLSARRMHRASGGFAGKSVADVGCGYHASFARTLLPTVRALLLVDVSLAAELRAEPKVQAIEGRLPDALAEIPSGSLDVVMCNSVIEHLWMPGETIAELARITASGGVLLINVPSWRGKWFLELAAFRLGVSPADEMNDHKSYFDPRDLWPLLRRAGFRPDHIRCHRHKFGLNTFAVCRKDGD
ncbi:MAG: class I SAM-dependent methyltransferase [Candidatus Dormibacteria bacterium]